MEIKGRRILVYGLGKTGSAVIQTALDAGANVFAYDDNPPVNATVFEGAPLLTREQAAIGDFDLCVISPGVPPGNEFVQTLLRRDILVISEIELAYFLSPAPIAAVTGTNGKSTTTVLAGKMLEASGKKTWIGGNLSAEGYDLPLITAVRQASSDDVIVAEISSFQLERCFSFRPKVAALLNISEDHLNRYDSLNDYAAAKMRIFQSQTSEDAAVLGWDDPLVRKLGKNVTASRLWFSGTEPVEQGAFEQDDSLFMRVSGTTHHILQVNEMKLWAFYDRLNVLAAACIAWKMGATLEGIRQAAVAFSGLPHRMEECGTINGVHWFNSSMCTNPEAGISAVKAAARRFPTILIAGGTEKECSYTQWGEETAAAAKTVILIGKDSGILRKALENTGLKDIHQVEKLPQAMELARRMAVSGDAVILAPAMASFGEFSNFRERGQQFRDIVERFRREADI